ncbi:hypothetical protein CISIN_1g042635mg [Citrus sinensis]|uniref:SKP1 component POZ domain-containing protein n=1 Tax=Citrus sinensis TaxID=2711 RepID=A0A067DBI8_CITSI|nr:hypothetical protein CISIN_1g042635mg [Citrus sinensis]
MRHSKKISLKRADGQLFEVEEPVAMDFEIEDTVVPLPNVSTEPLSYIIEFCKAHVEFSKQRSPKQEMLDYWTETLANRIKNKSVQYVGKFFGIENNFTPKEEVARTQYEWAFEGLDPDDDD